MRWERMRYIGHFEGAGLKGVCIVKFAAEQSDRKGRGYRAFGGRMTQGVKSWNEYGVVHDEFRVVQEEEHEEEHQNRLESQAMQPVSKKNGQADSESVR